MKCIHCNKGDLFFEVINSEGEMFLKCVICSFNNKYEDIFSEKKESTEEELTDNRYYTEKSDVIFK